MPLIKNREIVEDQWHHVAAADDPVPEGDVIVPLALWQARRDELQTRNSRLGLRLEPGEHPSEIAGDLDRFAVIALNFPTFRDGRAYSYARVLRERYGYTGEIRAVGDVLRDQIFFMSRCGFDAFDVRADKNAAHAIAGLDDFSVTYQNAADTELPHFRR